MCAIINNYLLIFKFRSNNINVLMTTILYFFLINFFLKFNGQKIVKNLLLANIYLIQLNSSMYYNQVKMHKYISKIFYLRNKILLYNNKYC